MRICQPFTIYHLAFNIHHLPFTIITVAVFLQIPLLEPDIYREQRHDGAVLLASQVPLGPCPHRITERLVYWAKQTPDRVFLAQKNGGTWVGPTYGQALGAIEALGQHLLQSPMSPERPLAILSENSVEHGLMALGALHVGLPYSAIAPAYALRSTDYAKLRHVINLLTPGLVFVQHGGRYEKALAAVGIPPERVVAVEGVLPGQLDFKTLLQTPPTIAVEQAYNSIQPHTVAKILFTSGSTGLPKGVINTHGNITTNWQQITQTFPFFENGGLTLLDWLPWNHTFGGNHNFGLTLFNGGSLYLDEGNPTPTGIQTTLENLREIAPTVYFNVPKGFEELLPYLRADETLCKHFFSRLKMFFYAGAGMAQHVWDALEDLAFQTTGKRLLIGSGLGMTEACPSAMFNTRYGSRAGMIGLPVPGLTLKLVPDGDKWEARFQGKNITPGYWRNPEATAQAFDEEGYYKTGDALKFADPTDLKLGLVFDGRIAEDFKLDTGTWVSTGPLRAKLIAAGRGLIQDVVITGHDRAFLGAIVFPDLYFCRRLAGLDESASLAEVVKAPAVLAALEETLETCARQSTGSSTLIRRAVLADFPLSLDRGEITDKGSVNQRAVLSNHAELVEEIYRDEG